jgi:hypothetical protein
MSEFLYQVGGGGSKKKSKDPVIITNKEFEGRPYNSAIEWRTGFRERFPWVGFGALAIIVTCIISVVLILVTSDGKAKEQWPAYMDSQWIGDRWKERGQISPSVTLAIMNTISNVCLAVAIGQGVAIAWWRKAIKGATVEDLHRSWGFSASLLEVLRSGSRFNIIGLAALAAKVSSSRSRHVSAFANCRQLALIDNLLLQRAADTKPGFLTRSHINISLPFSTELPAGYAGEFAPDSTTGAISDAFSSDIYRYSTSAELIRFNDTWGYTWDSKDQVSRSTFDTRCVGTCKTIIDAFGFSVQCSDARISESYDVTPSIVLASTKAVHGDGSAPANFSRSLLSVNASALLPGSILHGFNDAPATFDYGAIVASIRYTRNIPSSGDLNELSATTCTGHYVERICVLRPAILSYPVDITNITGSGSENGVQIDLPSTVDLTERNLTSTDLPLAKGQIPGINVLRPAFSPYSSSFDSNIQGIATMLQALFGATVDMDYTTGDDGGYVPTGSGANPLSVWW